MFLSECQQEIKYNMIQIKYIIFYWNKPVNLMILRFIRK